MQRTGQGLRTPTHHHSPSPSNYATGMTATVADLMDLLGFDDKDPAASWRDQALCAEVDGELFFPEKGGTTKEAKRICSRCDVRDACLAFALDTGERFGIWGGLSERERRRLRPQRPMGRPPRERRPQAIDHGTEAGWKAHRRLGEDPCRPCKDGVAAARRRRLAAQPPSEPLPPPVAVERPGVTRPWTPDEQVEVVRLLTEYGMTPAEIAPELGISLRHVERIHRLTSTRRRAA